MKTYEVSRVVTGMYRVTVNASSPEEAEGIATDLYERADFGSLTDVDNFNSDNYIDSTEEVEPDDYL